MIEINRRDDTTGMAETNDVFINVYFGPRHVSGLPVSIPLSFDPKDDKYRTCCKKVHCVKLMWYIGPIEFLWLFLDQVLVVGFVGFQLELINSEVLIPWFCMILLCLAATLVLFNGLRQKEMKLIIPEVLLQFLLIPILLICGASTASQMLEPNLLNGTVLTMSSQTTDFPSSPEQLYVGALLASSLIFQGLMEFFFIRVTLSCLEFCQANAKHRMDVVSRMIIQGPFPDDALKLSQIRVQPKPGMRWEFKDDINARKDGATTTISNQKSRYWMPDVPEIVIERGNNEDYEPDRVR